MQASALKGSHFARFDRRLLDAVHAHRIGNALQDIQRHVEVADQRVNLVAVDRRREGLVQALDHLVLDLITHCARVD
jgi:hypothetical protein